MNLAPQEALSHHRDNTISYRRDNLACILDIVSLPGELARGYDSRGPAIFPRYSARQRLTVPSLPPAARIVPFGEKSIELNLIKKVSARK